MDDEAKKPGEAMFRYLLRAVAIATTVGFLMAFGLAKLLASGAPTSAVAKPNLVLYPVFVMFLLVAAVLTRMGWLRVGAVLYGTMDVEFYKTYDKGEEPEAFRVVTRHFINLFEMPVLFYVGVIMAYVTQQVTFWLVGLAWAFVLLRLFHAYVHLTSNDVPTRLSGYASSGLMLLAFWISLFTQLMRAG